MTTRAIFETLLPVVTWVWGNRESIRDAPGAAEQLVNRIHMRNDPRRVVIKFQAPQNWLNDSNDERRGQLREALASYLSLKLPPDGNDQIEFQERVARIRFPRATVDIHRGCYKVSEDVTRTRVIAAIVCEFQLKAEHINIIDMRNGSVICELEGPEWAMAVLLGAVAARDSQLHTVCGELELTPQEAQWAPSTISAALERHATTRIQAHFRGHCTRTQVRAAPPLPTAAPQSGAPLGGGETVIPQHETAAPTAPPAMEDSLHDTSERLEAKLKAGDATPEDEVQLRRVLDQLKTVDAAVMQATPFAGAPQASSSAGGGASASASASGVPVMMKTGGYAGVQTGNIKYGAITVGATASLPPAALTAVREPPAQARSAPVAQAGGAPNIVRISHFDVNVSRVLGTGGFGTVYHATDIVEGTQVAAKQMSNLRVRREKSEHEVKMMKAVGDHPSIIKFFEVVHFGDDHLSGRERGTARGSSWSWRRAESCSTVSSTRDRSPNVRCCPA